MDIKIVKANEIEGNIKKQTSLWQPIRIIGGKGLHQY